MQSSFLTSVCTVMVCGMYKCGWWFPIFLKNSFPFDKELKLALVAFSFLSDLSASVLSHVVFLLLVEPNRLPLITSSVIDERN